MKPLDQPNLIYENIRENLKEGSEVKKSRMLSYDPENVILSVAADGLRLDLALDGVKRVPYIA